MRLLWVIHIFDEASMVATQKKFLVVEPGKINIFRPPGGAEMLAILSR